MHTNISEIKKEMQKAKPTLQFVAIKPLSLRGELTSFASWPRLQGLQCCVSSNQVIRQKNFKKRLASSTGLYMDCKLQADYCYTLSFISKIGP